ncbi:MAG: D-aminoacyl-tRNA deacylase [Acidobacteriota bacterium]
MKVVIQRVLRAGVRIDQTVHASIGEGLVVLVGVEKGDDENTATAAAEKIADLRIFAKHRGKDDRMGRSVLDVGGEILVISEFTLAGSLRRGHRPSFDGAAPAPAAEAIYRRVAEVLHERGIPVRTGVFGAMMQVELVNDGPVTFVLETGR